MLTDFDISPLELEGLGVNFEEQTLNFIRIIRRVHKALELLSCILEVKCIAHQHLLKFAFKSRSPPHGCEVLDHATFSVWLRLRVCTTNSAAGAVP